MKVKSLSESTTTHMETKWATMPRAYIHEQHQEKIKENLEKKKRLQQPLLEIDTGGNLERNLKDFVETAVPTTRAQWGWVIRVCFSPSQEERR
jgi:hypothetical protein